MSFPRPTMFLAAVLALVSVVQCRPGVTSLSRDANPDSTGRSRRQVDETLQFQAFEYYKKLHQEYSCALPQLRIIPVQKIHPTNSVSYTTGSVLLHRCAEDTGCCAPSLVCVAQETETVTLPILILKPGHEEEDPQMMPFVNHTMCHCVSESTLNA